MTTDLSLLQIRRRIADFRGRGVYQGYPNEHRCIFIHIPKTAGSAIVESLFGAPSRHVPYTEYEKANPRKFREYFKFCFVRNPWDRLVSSYFYLRKGGAGGQDKVWADRHMPQYADFADFVRRWVNEDNIRTWVHFQPQHSFVCDESLRTRMDFIGRVETIEADFDHVRRRLDIDATLKFTNSSGHRHYGEYYTDELRERVASVYADDIAIFGYEFEAR
ncbi:MAG TPA: sulfotransferase family 2 domain-containing protein, partial [Pseudolabrys sp.]|nr:sulfotransferase family 2 domain-containing protein [Pseudolabrys sp.]